MTVTQEERTALALAALGEVTDPADVGELIAVEQPEPGVVDLRFACSLAAYAGWSWVVSTADLPDLEPTVLEVELLPGDSALLAPPWVPWTERLAEWRRQHPDELHPDEEADDADAEGDEGDLDEDDLAVDDVLDELDDAELEGTESPEGLEQGSDDGNDDDDASEGDASDDDSQDDSGADEDDGVDDREVRPADEDRGP